MLSIGLPRGLDLALLVSLAGIACLDFLTGTELVIWALYLVPVALVSWMAGFRKGAIVSVGIFVLMLAVGLMTGHSFPTTGYFVVAVANRVLALLVVAWLTSRLYRKQALEATLKSYQETLDYYHLSPLPDADRRENKATKLAGTRTEVLE